MPRIELGTAGWEARTLPLCYAVPPMTTISLLTLLFSSCCPVIKIAYLPFQQVEWLEEAKEVMEEPHAGAFERMKEVLEAGMELSPHPAVEKALGEISGLLSQVFTGPLCGSVFPH